MTINLSLLSMFLIGLLGAGHCVGMCGGIAAALGFATGEQHRWPILLGYNLGRITSYAVAGAIVSQLGQLGSTYLSMGPILRILAGLLLVAMGLYLSGWWLGLTRLERLGQKLWHYIQPFGNQLLPATNLYQGLLLGALWGWLPCGLVYSALAFTATQGQPQAGALAMLAFGLGTAPAMLLGGVLGNRLISFLQRAAWRKLTGLLLILFGFWTMWLPAQPHSTHGTQPNPITAPLNQHH